MSEIGELLHKIQQELKAPKGQMNSFGGYKYRSCEDIVEAVKPLLRESGAVLILFDDMVHIGDRYYIKATAQIGDGKGAVIESYAYAREPEHKKGMGESQITGAASSYARKYALNGLFAIDDTKDADTMDNRVDNTREPDIAKVGNAVLTFKKLIDDDNPEIEETAKSIREIFDKLTHDEKLMAGEGLKDKSPGTNKMYKSILKEYLEMTK